MNKFADFIARNQYSHMIILAVLLLVILPLSMDIFRLNLVGKYLTYAFVALGLVLCWGYGGILSLGQGVFFGEPGGLLWSQGLNFKPLGYFGTAAAAENQVRGEIRTKHR